MTKLAAAMEQVHKLEAGAKPRSLRGFASQDRQQARRSQSKGGRAGGPARAAKLSEARRAAIARAAARARWRKDDES